MKIIRGNLKLVYILGILFLNLITVIQAQKQQNVSSSANNANLPQRQLEDDDDETTPGPTVPPVTVSPEQIYSNLNTAFNVTTGIVQDIICRIPFLRLCEGANAIKLMTYPIPPTTIPTTTKPTTPAPLITTAKAKLVI